MAYRVDELAKAADVSVDTVRYYQSKGLLPPPVRSGRVAHYGEEHLARLHRIRGLQAKGLTLATIRRLLDGELDAADEALVTAVSATDGGDPANDPEESFSLEELAERSRIPLPLLQAVMREGLLVPRRVGGQERYTEADVAAARAGLSLLEAGLPLPEVLDLARRHHAAMREVAERAVALFDEHIRHPARASADDDAAAERLVDAFNALLPATTTLVAHHFRRTLLAVAQEHIERVGDDAELAAVEREAGRIG
ncbi:MAG TPA: MerR family transcriptional regulator [Acidimicrobiales bacterium]|jgi:DNA-binding transcriptional MerR regulator|nr:MerR family transcriptional regulator [Acidimicrobiales bacterium]